MNHKIISITLTNFKLGTHFHTSLKHEKPGFFYVPMGYRNGMFIEMGLWQETVHFFQCCTSTVNIMCGSWAFHSPVLYIIRAGNKNIYLSLFAYIVKSSYFSRWNSKWYEKLIVCLMIFNLKQGYFLGF